jgi:hypothetical protein
MYMIVTLCIYTVNYIVLLLDGGWDGLGGRSRISGFSGHGGFGDYRGLEGLYGDYAGLTGLNGYYGGLTGINGRYGLNSGQNIMYMIVTLCIYTVNYIVLLYL